jgi:hypothetical protein
MMHYSLALHTRNGEPMKNVTSQSLSLGMDLTTQKNMNRAAHYMRHTGKQKLPFWTVCYTQISLHPTLLHFLQWTDISGPQAMFHNLKKIFVLLASTWQVHRYNIWHHIPTEKAHTKHSFYFQLNFLYDVWGSHSKELCIKVLWNVKPCSLVETCLSHYMALYSIQLRS